MNDARGNGLNKARLDDFRKAVERDLERGLYHGGAFVIARHGEIGFYEALGFAYAGKRQPMARDSVFSIFSATKAFTNVLILRAVERGAVALTTPVSAVIPEFSGGLRDRLTIYHLLTHRTGIAPLFTPKPGMYIDRLNEVIAAICEAVYPEEEPGVRVTYSPMVAHALLGEILRRTDPAGRSYRQIVAEDLFEPLAMEGSAIGVRSALRQRKIVPDFSLSGMRVQHLGHSDLGENGAFEEEDAEMPWVGAVSTALDLHRFAEMLRQHGRLESARIISPATLERATQNQTGEMPNELSKRVALARGWEPGPAYIGLGFSLRGDSIGHNQLGTLTSPRTFGNYGAGSILFWVDPVRDVSFVAVTAGVMESGNNTERFQRLSDIAISAAD